MDINLGDMGIVNIEGAFMIKYEAMLDQSTPWGQEGLRYCPFCQSQ